MEKAKIYVDQKIAGKKVVMFSKTYCPFCTKAKKALQKHKLTDDEYECIEIENDPNASAIQDYLMQLTGGRTVPRVFIGGDFIGGGDETEQADRDGTLTKLLGK